MINGLGVVGWGVGGIEAEAVMLGQPLYMLMPEVVGFEADRQAARRRDRHRPGADRDRDPAEAEGVVGKFVEFFGPGVCEHDAGRPGDDRQHGARVRRHDGLLPGRRRRRSTTCARPAAPTTRSSWSSGTAKEQQLFRTADAPDARAYTKVLSLDLGTVEPSLAGPKRPQDRVPLSRA